MPLLPRLVERYRVHSVDLPGHGHSPPIAPYSIALLAHEVAAAVAALPDVAGAPPVVLGWSMGGLVAMEWARTRPDSMLGLVLSSSTACFVQRPDWPHAMAATTLAQFGDEFAASYRRTLLRFLTLQARGSEQGRAALAQLHDHLLDRGEPAPATLRAAFAFARDHRHARRGTRHRPAVAGPRRRSRYTCAKRRAALARQRAAKRDARHRCRRCAYPVSVTSRRFRGGTRPVLR